MTATALLQLIAREPRPTGGPAIAAAREHCVRELRTLGFAVRERSFEFSEFPGRFATPLVGGVAALIVGIAGSLALAGARWEPLVVVAVSSVALGLASVWLARRGVLRVPLLRRTGVNLECARPGDEPRVWLCAHLDSKSQPVPTLLRSAGVVVEGAGVALTLVLAGATAAGWRVLDGFWGIAAVTTLAGAVPVVLSMVGARSPGALDNASGVATVLAAARALSAGGAQGIGVLITDAEELGLAGARAWAATHRAPVATTVLNCDGVDDGGDVAVMYSGRRPRALLAAVQRAAASAGVSARPSRLVPGVLTDSVAFADAGMATVTFSRGTFGSLARVHSVRDDLSRLRGSGIADVATLMAGTARILTSE